MQFFRDLKTFVPTTLGSFGFGIAVGFILGICSAAPLLGWHLPADVLTLFATACSGLAGAAAALLISEFRDLRSDRAARETVAKAIHDGCKPVQAILVALKQRKAAGQTAPADTEAYCKMALEEISFALERVELLKSLAASIGNGKGIFISDAELGFKKLQQQVTDIENSAANEKPHYNTFSIQTADLVEQKPLANPVGAKWIDDGIDALSPTLIRLASVVSALGVGAKS